MTDEKPPAAPEAGVGAPPLSSDGSPAPKRSRGGCAGRLLSALLVVVITTFLALAVGAAGLLYLGFTPTAPQQLDAAQTQLALLQSQNSSLQTQVAAQEQRGGADHEVLGDLKRDMADLADLRSQLKQERESSATQNATLVAEVRAGRDSVALFATAEAGRSALLAELDRRSARVERFLQRLGDIANDTALDIAGTTPVLPTLAASAAPPPTPTALPTLAPSATASPTPADSPTPIATLAATARPAATSTATPTVGASATPARTPSPTARPRLAPTATNAPSPTPGR